jgi:type IV pilus assembly protein PilB
VTLPSQPDQHAPAGGHAPADEADQADPQRWTRRRLGDVLVERGAITEHQLHQVLDDQRLGDDDDRIPRMRLGRLLVQSGLVNEETIASALAEVLGREVVDAAQLPIDPSWSRLLPRSIADRSQVLVLGPGPRGLQVLAADPTDVVALDDVRRHTGEQQLDVLVGVPSQVRDLLDRLWTLDSSSEAVAEIHAVEDDPGIPEDATGVADAPTVRLLDSILADAVRARASDIHLEQQVASLRVRYRVDGLLREVLTLPRGVGRMLTARVKVVAAMDIAERRIPQDGRVRLSIDGGYVDARVSTMPAVHGEKTVIRLLPAVGSVGTLDALGLDDDQLAAVQRTLRAPQGLVLITGPTGSGKTNTLYAAIGATITPERNVVTLEDPVEIELPGITQVPIDERTGMTFVRGLRALLRQDPDVVLVGEVRDTVTAELALRAAMTGHLVLTTLHTHDAPAALPRLVDMGVPPYLVASALTLVVGQRLVRRPCPSCARAYVPDDGVLAALDLTAADLAGARPTHGAGCPRCSGTGHLGRRALFEILEVTPPLRRALMAGTDEAALADLAREHGFTGLREHGLRVAAAGETTYEEVLRVTRAGV